MNIVKRAATVTICAAAVLAGTASGAVAGEVKGPPGAYNTNLTGALDHANSICAASGLNDMIPGEGQTVSIVQTAADSFKYYGLPKGFVGIACRGGGSH